MISKSRFELYISDFTPSKVILPLVHYTNSFKFRDIVERGGLEAQPCPHFKESLLYFFYGRPAYRKISTPLADDSYNPICLILKQQSLKNMRRAFPFDSGAFFDGCFDQHINKSMCIDDFLLSCSIAELSKIVTAFFGNNYNYYLGQYVKDKKFTYNDFEAKALYSILIETGKTVHDDRGYTIEVQTQLRMNLEKNIDAIVLPYSAFQNAVIQNTILNKWKAVPLLYDTYRGSRSEEYSGVIRDRIRLYLENSGYFND